jgi:hypothetical protein
MKTTTKPLRLGAAIAALASIAVPGVAAVAAEPRNSPARELAAMRLIPFERMDADQSGELGDTELPIPLSPSFPRADTNGSGGIDRAELEAELARLEARLARGPALDPAAPPRSFQALDAALDTLVAHHETRRFEPRSGTSTDGGDQAERLSVVTRCTLAFAVHQRSPKETDHD